MKNRGRFLAILLCMSSMLVALDLKLSPQTIRPGDRVTLTISAQGKEVVFPKIKKIGGSAVLEESSGQNITLEKGKLTKTFTKNYVFEANRSFTLSPIEVQVDGKTLRTKPTRVTVEKKKSRKNGAFFFTLVADKTEAYVGEPIHITYTFRQKLDQKLVEANFNPPQFRDFWTKMHKKLPQEIEGEYIVYRITYTLTAKHPGKAKIEPARMDVGIMRKKKMADYSFERVRWKSVYANSLDFTIKPLPEGVSLFGNYKMEAFTDTNVTKANEPIHLTVRIEGEGNLDELESFSLKIPDATVYGDKARVSTVKGKQRFIQKFAILSDRNFTIPPLKVRYLDNKEHRVKSLETPQIPIRVLSFVQRDSQTSVIEPESQRKTPHPGVRIETAVVLSLLSGFLTGMLMMWSITKQKRKREKKKTKPTAREAIAKSRNDKELLSHLLPYSQKSPSIQQIIEQLEENLYMGGNHKIDPKKVAKALPDLLTPPKEEEILR